MSSRERLLAVSIGNTNVSFGLFDGGQLVAAVRRRADARRLTPSWPAPGAIVIGSVNPKASLHVSQSLRKRYGLDVLELGSDLAVPVRNRCRRPERVGVDRLLNALAACRLVCCPVIVADLGTAITIDAVSARGDFLGGAILPGAGLWTAALHERTAKLPAVGLKRSSRVIGKQTEEAIRSGVYWGICGAIEKIAARMRKRLRSEAQLLVTGGDADLFSPHLPKGHVVMPHLALHGIHIAWSAWREEGKGEG
ncbi:MAG: type III pantothenate kinase [Planctomycetota bacterium]